MNIIEQINNCNALIAILERIEDEDYNHDHLPPVGDHSTPCCAYGHARRAGLIPADPSFNDEAFFGEGIWENVFYYRGESGRRDWTRQQAIEALRAHIRDLKAKQALAQALPPEHPMLIKRVIHFSSLVRFDKPKLLGAIGGYRFYEHPHLGNEVPILAYKDGILGYTEFYDMDSIRDFMGEQK